MILDVFLNLMSIVDFFQKYIFLYILGMKFRVLDLNFFLRYLQFSIEFLEKERLKFYMGIIGFIVCFIFEVSLFYVIIYICWLERGV